MHSRRAVLLVLLIAPGTALAHGSLEQYLLVLWDLLLVACGLGYLVLGHKPFRRRLAAIIAAFTGIALGLFITGAIGPHVGWASIIVTALSSLFPIAGFLLVLRSWRVERKHAI